MKVQNRFSLLGTHTGIAMEQIGQTIVNTPVGFQGSIQQLVISGAPIFAAQFQESGQGSPADYGSPGITAWLDNHPEANTGLTGAWQDNRAYDPVPHLGYRDDGNVTKREAA